ncbi:MAG: DUF1501 domain-containing protein [Lutibacter sp.]|uniref:DUF1501 domain-containing protein n=1 Tax=Lutibacter sp. TaxID=1925666 RepID=UPI00385EA815
MHTKKYPQSKLEEIHNKEHAVWNRRSFLQALGLASAGSMVIGKVNAAAATLTPLSAALAASESENILILVRLKGGNDGLNTVIPYYDYDKYANLRPSLKINTTNSFALSNDFRMPNYMNSLESFWGEGKMKVVHGVGYENQSLSHFSSADIWSSAGNKGEVLQTGVFGRYYEELYPDYLLNPPENPPAIQIGGQSNLMFVGEQSSYAFSAANIDQLTQIAENGTAYDMQNLPGCDYGDQLGFLRSVNNTTFNYANVIGNAYNKVSNEVNYENNKISKQFALVARLIKGDLKTKIYMVTLDGFDTHAAQATSHQKLMSNLTEAISNFYKDLAVQNLDTNVLTMTISEFGRRAKENASDGTDHGAASTMLLFGKGLNGSGFVGNHPDLSDLDSHGNLKPSNDFREVYASILENLFCIDSAIVDETLRNEYNRLNLGITCSSKEPNDLLTNGFKHYPIYADNTVYVEFILLRAMQVDIQLINMLGQNIGTIHKERHVSGTYRINLNPYGKRYSLGQYIYRIIADGKAYSKSIILTK